MRIKGLILIVLMLALGACTKSGWTEFHSSPGGFAVTSPGPLADTTILVGTAVGPIEMTTNMIRIDDYFYGVAWSDYPQIFIDSTPAENILSGARDGAVANIKGRLLDDRPIHIGDHPGREFEIEIAGGRGVMKMRIYLVGRRLFQVTAGTVMKNTSSPDMERFLDSFRLMEKA
nr:hypothetical protein [candidate division Zixibacteria bacterium]